MNQDCEPGFSFSAWPLSLILMMASLFLAPPLALADEPPARPAGIDADRLLAQKISAYIDCINRHSNWTMGSRERYLDWIKDAKRGPTGREPVIYGLYPLYDISDCRAGIEKAANLPPAYPEIEQSAAAWVEAFVTLDSLVAEANRYYELENYKDDKMAKGKSMHPQLMEAFERFDAANNALYGQVVTTQDGLAERRLQRLAGDPALEREYLFALLNDRAKQIVRLMDSVGTKSFDRDGFATAVSEYEKAYFEADAYSTQQSGQSKEAFDSIMMMMALEYLKSAKSLMRSERGGFRFSAGERMFIEDGSGEMVEGHPKHLVDRYNRFIDASNRSSRHN
ncbi:YiiG family protein [Dokdonella sp.]|uniref:YiiG family protein n=1 Tax=Dokdonella sp. TaxID=2291710 RepID=UPI003528A1C5